MDADHFKDLQRIFEEMDLRRYFHIGKYHRTEYINTGSLYQSFNSSDRNQLDKEELMAKFKAFNEADRYAFLKCFIFHNTISKMWDDDNPYNYEKLFSNIFKALSAFILNQSYRNNTSTVTMDTACYNSSNVAWTSNGTYYYGNMDW